jgi:Putative transposase
MSSSPSPNRSPPLLTRTTKDVVYGILFRATAETLSTIAADPELLGAEIGFFAVLHSWGQNLLFHPHLHCVVPGGGISLDGTAIANYHQSTCSSLGVPRLLRQKSVVVVVADHTRDPPHAILVLPQHDKLGVSHILCILRVVKTMNPDLDRSISLQRVDFQRAR